jgi:catechol 1,2-dioxygenase
MVEQSGRSTSRRDFLVKAGMGGVALGLLNAGKALAFMAPTVPNLEGPFHRKNAPFRKVLAGPGEPGDRLVIRGRVLDTDGKPLKGAVVDVWQANQAGHYDNDGSSPDPAPDEFHLRGQMKTDAAGNYEFESIVPGRYDMGPGQKRPSHIHYIVTCPGFVPLTTQLYFKGDPYIANDPFVRPELIIDLAKRGTVHHGTFDVVLARPVN